MIKFFKNKLVSEPSRIVGHILCLLISVVIIFITWSVWSDIDSRISLYNRNILPDLTLMEFILAGCLLAILLIWTMNFLFFLAYSHSRRSMNGWEYNHFKIPQTFTIIILIVMFILFLIIWSFMDNIALSIQGITRIRMDLASFNRHNIWIPFGTTLIMMVLTAVVQLKYLPPMNTIPPVTDAIKAYKKAVKTSKTMN